MSGSPSKGLLTRSVMPEAPPVRVTVMVVLGGSRVAGSGVKTISKSSRLVCRVPAMPLPCASVTTTVVDVTVAGLRDSLNVTMIWLSFRTPFWLGVGKVFRITGA